MTEIVISGPNKNALSGHLMAALMRDLHAAGREPVLLRGEGDAFSAGLDLKEVASLDREGMTSFLTLLETLIETLYLHPAPTVACVAGHAIAGGCVLALCCDHRVATDGSRARIGLTEVAVGVTFPPRALAVSRQRVPVRHLEQVVLGAQLHPMANAQRLGLVDEITSDPLGRARAHLDELARLPRDAYAEAKRALRAPLMARAAADREQFETAVDNWTSEPVKERLRAALRPRR